MKVVHEHQKTTFRIWFGYGVAKKVKHEGSVEGIRMGPLKTAATGVVNTGTGILKDLRTGTSHRRGRNAQHHRRM
jgi:hypothetical protein